MSQIIAGEESSKPTAPSVNTRKLYPKSDGWYQLTSGDVESKLEGATSLDELSDVDVTSPVEGNFLVYNSSTSKFENSTPNAVIFGCSFTEVSTTTQQTNGTTTFQNYLTLNASACVVGGKYRIGAFIDASMSSTSDNFEARLQVQEGSGTPVTLGIFQEEFKEAGTDARHPRCGFFYYTVTSDANLTVTMDFRPENATETAFANAGSLEFWRVS